MQVHFLSLIVSAHEQFFWKHAMFKSYFQFACLYYDS